MAITAKDVLTLVRRQLGDEEAAPRWDDPLLIRHLVNRQREVIRRRPWEKVSSAEAFVALTDPTLSTSALLLDEDWLEGLANGVTASALFEDTADKASAFKAQQFADAFEKRMAS